MTSVTIYTDGSCHTRQRVGAWVAILLTGSHKHVLSGTVPDTTHNRMELTAVIKALEYLRESNKLIYNLTICSDSQYVIGLTARESRLSARGFTTSKGKELPNADLVKELLDYFRLFTIEFVKIKAHQKKTEIVSRNAIVNRNAIINHSEAIKHNEAINYNIEADLLARKLVRAASIF